MRISRPVDEAVGRSILRSVAGARPVGALLLALAALAANPLRGDGDAHALRIFSPLEGALFPRDFASPVFRWEGASGARRFRVRVEGLGLAEPVIAETTEQSWRPAPAQWEAIKRATIGRSARLSVRAVAVGSDEGRALSTASVSFGVSEDPVEASIVFREVPLPVGFAMDNKPMIRWLVGDVSSTERPRVVLGGMSTCTNCHSYSADGKTLGMDVDFGVDKGSYAITDVETLTRIGRDQMISWNDYRSEDGIRTLGMLSALSPDGRFAVSTVKETIVLRFMPDPFCSQLFFPARGILAVYDRHEKRFAGVRGASDEHYVQTNPAYSPDGKWLVFARAPVPELPPREPGLDANLPERLVDEFEDGRRKIRFDLYQIPFNDGKGGEPRPIPGASANGKSNFFPRFSPDGKWIVFCQADSMMLNRPDSLLYILPAKGGEPRRMRCNAEGRMNSWHSFSPNGRWLVYASKRAGPQTQMWLTHVDEKGEDSVPVLLDGFVSENRAANLPEFVKLAPGQLQSIEVAREIRNSGLGLPKRP